MNTHQGYKTASDGAECSECGDWIEPGEESVILQPAEIEENGGARPTAVAIHGVLHKSCFEDL